MVAIKVEYGSSHSISVRGVEYFDVPPEDLNDDGTIPESFLSDVWQHAVNEFMDDTSVTVVESADTT